MMGQEKRANSPSFRDIMGPQSGPDNQPYMRKVYGIIDDDNSDDSNDEKKDDAEAGNLKMPARALEVDFRKKDQD